MPSWLFPQGGINRAVGKQRQPPYTTPDAQNAFPESPQDGRIRGGVRPGLVRTWHTSASNSPVRLLDSVSVKFPGSAQWYFRDSFDYVNFPPSWTKTNNCITGVTSTAPTITKGSITSSTSDAVPQKAIYRSAPTDMKSLATNDVYMLGMYVRSFQGAHHGVYSIYFRLDASPDVTPSTGDANAMEVRMTITGATGACAIQLYKQGAALGAVYNDSALVAAEGWLQVKVTKAASDDRIDVYWRGVNVIANSTSTGTTTDKHFGFGLKATESGGRCIVDRVRLDYTASAAKELLRPIVFFIQDGKLFHDKLMPGHFTQSSKASGVASLYQFAADRQLQCASHGQRVYFADHATPIMTGTDGVIAGGATFSSATFPDLVAGGLSTNTADNNYFGNFAVHVTGPATPSSKAGVYAISALTTASNPDTLTIYKHVNTSLAPVAAGATDGTGLTFRIERIPKVWNPADEGTSTDPIKPWVTIENGGYQTGYGSGFGFSGNNNTNSGVVPCGCRAIESDGGRVHLAADPLDPNQVYGCAIGEPHNWSFSDVEPGSAFKLGGADAAKPGDAVMGLMFVDDDVKLVGCRTECWILRSAPPDGGGGAQVRSRHSGLLSFSAYCRGENGELYWLGRNGAYMSTADFRPQPINEGLLPRELQDLDAASITILAGYDRRARGVLFCLTPEDPVAEVRHWFYYAPTKAFFPLVITSAGAYPTSLKWIEFPDPEDSALYSGGYGGSIRRFSPTSETDDLDPITSFVDIGPIELGDGRFDEALTTLRPILAADSGDVTYEVYFGATMEAAMDATEPFATGTFSATNNVEVPIRGSGGAVRLRLIGTAGRQWAMERIVAAIEHVQKAR
ncbi:MAG: hypothetical protein SGJ19_06500 [Planctomycetia bacterium]|nr:hypothetical protein [Planctomycetia bacterium]